MSLGWAIIGAGMHPHLKIAPAINAAQGGELVAVYSRDQGRGDTFAQNHGAKAAYDSVEALLKDPRVDAVFVSSPNALHAQHTIQAAKAGKHVLSEKPLATSVEDALAMVQECRANGVKMGTGFELRHNPGHVSTRDLISQGALGRVSLAQGQWCVGLRGQRDHIPRTELREWWEQPEMMGGASVMMGLGVHVIDFMRFILGREVIEVTAMTDGQTEAQPLENLATLCMRLEGEVIATACCGRMLPDTRNDFAVYGTDGRVTGETTLWEAQLGRVQVASETVNWTEVYPYNYLANFIAELEDFQEAIEEDREAVGTGIDGLRATQVTSAAIQSAKTGRAVKLESLDI